MNHEHIFLKDESAACKIADSQPQVIHDVACNGAFISTDDTFLETKNPHNMIQTIHPL